MFEYPITKRNKINGMVIEFTGLCEGKIIKTTEFFKENEFNVGDKLYDIFAHTNTEIWENCDYKERPAYYYE